MNGLHADRLKPNQNNPREVAFTEEWAKEHEHNDLFAQLFAVPCDRDDPDVDRLSLGDTFGPRKYPLGRPTDRDRIVAATVIQWLGSNVGIGFLQESLNRAGYGIKYPSAVEDWFETLTPAKGN